MKIIKIKKATEVDIKKIKDTKSYAKARIQYLKEQLNNTDYYVLKVQDKAMTEEAYEPMRLQRQVWRDEINELEQQLKIIESE